MVVLVALWSCKSDPEPVTSPAPEPSTVPVPEPTEPSPTTPTTPTLPPRGGEFSAPELVLGTTIALRAWDLPAGTTVAFFASEKGEGARTRMGPVTIDMEEAFYIGETVTDVNGQAELAFDVPADAEPRPLYLQAGWTLGEAAGTSEVLLRNYTVPASQSPVVLTLGTAGADLGTITMSGNTHTGGSAWVDYNGDHWPDLFVSNGGGLDHYLFRNDGDGTFTDVSYLVPKPDIAMEDAGVVFADLENDGDLDLFVPVDRFEFMDPGNEQQREGGPNVLYVNDGDGTFTEASTAWNVLDPRGWRNITGAFADIDRDGFVDLYVGDWAMNAYPLGTYDRFQRMLHNEGGVTFVDVTDAVGLGERGLDNLVTIFYDADQDGWPDLYQGNVAHGHYAPPEYDPTNYLFMNSGDGTFVEGNPASPGFGDDATAAMGADVADIDGDGDWDLFITDIFDRFAPAGHDALPRGHALYLGNADGTVADNSCDVAGVCAGYLGWPSSYADFDRDGWVDLLVGHYRPGEPEMLFVNRGDGTFEHHDLAALGENDTTGGSIADFDGDGDMDMFLQNTAAPSNLVRNDAIDTHHWMEMRLFGTVSNRAAIGAMITFTTGDGLVQRRRVSGGDSAHSQQDLIVHLGLGDFAEAEVTVTWPNGAVQALGTLGADQLWFVDETAGLLDEELTAVSATWAAGTLTVTAKSSFGGRTGLSVDGVGLAWDPEAVQFVGQRAVPAPIEVTVTSDRGGSWVVPVVAR